MARFNHNSDLFKGRIQCPSCQGYLLPGGTICPFCGEPTPAPAPAVKNPAQVISPVPRVSAAKAAYLAQKAEPPAADTAPTAEPTKPVAAKNSTHQQRHKHLAALWANPAARTSWEAALEGNPITKGSGNAIAAGVYAHSNGDSLKRWEQAIEDAFAKLYRATDWEPLDVPLILDAVFTLPRPKGLPKNRIFYPDTRPDLDKLLRAAGDGLSTTRTDRIKHGPNAYKTHFNLIREDGRIVETHTYKTYPAPYHTHPAALTVPGVQLRVRLAPDPATLTWHNLT